MGLILNVYRVETDPDTSAGGLTSFYSRFCLVNASGPFDPSEDLPPVYMDSHVPGCLRIIPVNLATGEKITGGMFGGCYGETSDSRFSHLAEDILGKRFYGAVAIHDRFEGPKPDYGFTLRNRRWLLKG